MKQSINWKPNEHSRRKNQERHESQIHLNKFNLIQFQKHECRVWLRDKWKSSKERIIEIQELAMKVR
jgi:hypothetical protein